MKQSGFITVVVVGVLAAAGILGVTWHGGKTERACRDLGLCMTDGRAPGEWTEMPGEEGADAMRFCRITLTRGSLVIGSTDPVNSLRNCEEGKRHE